jgi:mannose-6-phosphate isomerase-like protein (cupin superfamily)
MTKGNPFCYHKMMIIQRWQAPQIPTEEQMLALMHMEGLDCSIEQWQPKVEVKEHRHLLTEVLFVISGSLILNLNGNQVLLRRGDRAEIPANTRHSYLVQDTSECRVIMGYRL